jgi:GH25 family lysozyme M1 (1,4-beta-N-acetylmuramidase)
LALTASATAGAARLEGVDVSRFNERIDWQQVGASGIGFAFVQASRGTGNDCAVKPRRCGPDERYEYNYAEARAAGVAVGAYHRAFADGRGRSTTKADAKAEAGVFITAVGRLRGGDLLPALDIETPFGSLDAKGLRLWVRTWLKRVERKLGARPIVYTNTTSWAATGDTTEFALAGHPLWVANWGVRRPSVPASDWAGESWSVWQYTSSGSVAGIDGHVDRNVLRGGLTALSVR